MLTPLPDASGFSSCESMADMTFESIATGSIRGEPCPLGSSRPTVFDRLLVLLSARGRSNRAFVGPLMGPLVFLILFASLSPGTRTPESVRLVGDQDLLLLFGWLGRVGSLAVVGCAETTDLNIRLAFSRLVASLNDQSRRGPLGGRDANWTESRCGLANARTIMRPGPARRGRKS